MARSKHDRPVFDSSVWHGRGAEQVLVGRPNDDADNDFPYTDDVSELDNNLGFRADAFRAGMEGQIAE